jgi:hypothetical protein
VSAVLSFVPRRVVTEGLPRHLGIFGDFFANPRDAGLRILNGLKHLPLV